MRLRVKDLDLSTGGTLVAVLNDEDARRLGIYAADRIRVKKGKREISVLIDVAENHGKVKAGCIGLFEEVLAELKLKNNDSVNIFVQNKPESLHFIKDKLDGKELSKEKIDNIVTDIVGNKLSEVEVGFFVSGCYKNELSLNEVGHLTEAIVNNSKIINFKEKTVDKHCLSGDVPVIVRNSSNIKIKQIDNIIDPLFEENKEGIIFNDGAEYLEKNPKGIQVLTFGDDGKVKFVKATGFFRAHSPKMLNEIILLGNRKIKVTSDHTVFILKNGEIINIPARDLKENDYVLVPRGFEKNVNPLRDIRVENSNNSRLKKIKDIQINREFMRLLAYYITEGFTNGQGIFLNFGSHEKDLIDDAKYCVEKVFGFKPTINIPHKTALRVTIYSQIVRDLFNDKIKAGCNALEKKIPPFIFDLDRELQLEFLRTLFRGDGYVRRGYEACYITSSKQLYLDLQYLLSLLGISVALSCKKAGKRMFPAGEYKVNESYFIYTQAREIFGERKNGNVSFINLLPISELGEINQNKIKDYEFRRSLKRQKFITRDKLRKYLSSFNSSDIHKIISEDLAVLPVKKNRIIKANTKYVYDFYVRGYNKFMAGTAPMAVHNCTGGIPANRTTMIVIPIVATAGLKIPKTSSRAITSPSGTADVMEVLAPVNLSREKIIKTVKKTNGCMVWGGALDLASADDKIIKIERILSLDPEGMLLSSIMAKKKAVNANYVLIDIPVGKEAKIKTKRDARRLKSKFVKLGRKLGMKVKVIISNGEQPIGNGVGPALEARDVMSVLAGDGPNDLKVKAIKMAGAIFSMVGIWNGEKKAKEILENGRALEKMYEIIKEQGGKIKDIEVGRFNHSVKSSKTGIVSHISNSSINKICRILGCPKDKKAGLYLNFKLRDRVKRGQELFTLYAESKAKLDYGVEFLKRNKIVEVR